MPVPVGPYIMFCTSLGNNEKCVPLKVFYNVIKGGEDESLN
jgi:hypothetical protein